MNPSRPNQVEYPLPIDAGFLARLGNYSTYHALYISSSPYHLHWSDLAHLNKLVYNLGYTLIAIIMYPHTWQGRVAQPSTVIYPPYAHAYRIRQGLCRSRGIRCHETGRVRATHPPHPPRLHPCSDLTLNVTITVTMTVHLTLI